MKKNLKIVIGIVIVAAFVVIGVALYLAFSDIAMRNKLTSEINSISSSTIDMEIKTTGKYAAVEEQVKADCKEYFETVEKLKVNFGKSSELKLINLENYKNDGPEFTESLKALNTLLEEDKACMETLNLLVSDEMIEARAEQAGLKGRYKDYYKQVIEDINLKTGVESAKVQNEKVDKYLNSVLDVINYLKTNSNNWFIENGALKSSSETFIGEYNKLVNATNEN